MRYPEKIDLHMHSTVSDGTDTPAEILGKVREAGLGLFSVTDHDAIKASGIIENMRTEDDPLFVTGVEFSCRDEEGKYHILGYGYDPAAASIRAVVETGHRYRMNKARGRLDCLEKEFGISFPPEEIKKLLARDNPGKPHIGNLMVQYGFAKTKEEAIEEYINRVRYRSEYVRPEEAVRGILEAGGVPVLAHPSYGSGDQLFVGTEMESRLRRLVDMGLQGVEAYYSGFTRKLTEELLSLAERYGLYVTAGSDYHGGNKLVRLGDTNLERASDGPEGMQRFLGRILGEE